MVKNMNFDSTNNKDRVPHEHYRVLYAAADPKEISARCGVVYDEEQKVFSIKLLGVTYTATHPDFIVTAEKDAEYTPLCSWAAARILILRYLVEGRLTDSNGEFLTYRDMPWGEVYNTNFQGRCITRLAYGFGRKLEAFKKAAAKIGGVEIPGADAACQVEFMPGLTIKLMLWAPDDEFPPSSQILFSRSFIDAFTAEDRAVVGDVLIDTLKHYG